MSTNPFARRFRIRSRKMFLSMAGLPRNHGRFMIIQQRRNGEANSRLGIVATRKIGGAVVRNRAKRLIRNVFRVLQKEIDPPRDLVIRLKPEAARASLAELREDLCTVLAKSQSK